MTTAPDIRDARAAAETLRVHMTGAEWFSDTPGGLNRYFTDLYCALTAREDVDASASAFGTPDVAGARSWGPSTGSTLSRVWSALSDDRALPRGAIVNRHFGLFGRPAHSLRGKHPLVVHFHGPWAAESAMSGQSSRAVRAKYWVERLRFLDADRFVVLSAHSRRLLVDDYGVDPAVISIIAPGVDLARFQLPETTATENTAETDAPTVLCVRRLERRMGIDRLIAGWPAVRARHPKARLVIVGTGSVEDELRRQAADSGVGESIEFTGRASDEALRAHYAAATVSVVPTVALEGFGLIALESCAVGRPPIVTDCGGLPDAVAGLDPSLVVPAGDVDALADRLARALAGDVPSAQDCRAHAESFSWAASAASHVDLYRELVSS